MKKLVLVAALFVAVNLVSKAQLSYGAKLGLNMANVTDSEMGSRMGIAIGGFANYEYSEKLSFQPELLYSMQGAKEDEATMKLDYLAIPILAKYEIGNGVNVQAGPQVGLLLSAKAKYDGVERDIKDGLNSLDFGLSLGVGYELEMGVSIDLRYNLGLMNIAEEGDGKNSVIQIGVGYAF